MRRLGLCGTVFAVVSLLAPAAQGATLVQLQAPAAWLAAPLLERTRSELLSDDLAIWRTDAETARRLGRAGYLRRAEHERAVPPLDDRFTLGDELLPEEYWIAAVGADRVVPPGPGKPVTVIDSGLDVSHPEFAGRPNTTLLNAQSFRGPREFHGTAVSSLVGATPNGAGIVGIYPQASLAAWDASPDGRLRTGEVIRGLEAASARGPGVINLSLGSTERDPLLEEAILHAFDRGSIVVAAVGNDGDSGSPNSFPGTLPHVLTVGATDERNGPTTFSSHSAAVDLSAPGVDIPVAVPTSYAISGYVRASGTSFSAPLVAGATAWVWTARPGLDKTQIFEVMRNSARDVLPKGFDVRTGFGLLDVPSALTFQPPAPDPLEPNDDVFLVRPGGGFKSGTAPLTDPRRRSRTLAGRLDATEDPQDVYRVWVPARSVVSVSVRGDKNTEVDAFGPGTRSVLETGSARVRDLQEASRKPGTERDLVHVRNEKARGFYAFAQVSLGSRVGDAGYRLSVSTAALPKPPKKR